MNDEKICGHSMHMTNTNVADNKYEIHITVQLRKIMSWIATNQKLVQ